MQNNENQFRLPFPNENLCDTNDCETVTFPSLPLWNHGHAGRPTAHSVRSIDDLCWSNRSDRSKFEFRRITFEFISDTWARCSHVACRRCPFCLPGLLDRIKRVWINFNFQTHAFLDRFLREAVLHSAVKSKPNRFGQNYSAKVKPLVSVCCQQFAGHFDNGSKENDFVHNKWLA